jgi:hypothetical protein
VSAVLDATSLSTAQIAASELIEQVLPGGAAVDPSALSLVELVAKLGQFALSGIHAGGTPRAGYLDRDLAASCHREPRTGRSCAAGRDDRARSGGVLLRRSGTAR